MLKPSESARAGLVFTVAILANLLYQLVLSLILQATGTGLTDNFWVFLLVQTLLPVVVILGVFLYVRRGRTCEEKSVFSLRPPAHRADWGWAVALGLSVCFFSGFLSNLFSLGLEKVGIPNPMSSMPTSDSAFGMILFIVVMAVLPALSEEFVFRGAFVGFARNLGTAAVCLSSGALFALMHMNVHQMLNAFLVGALLALVTLRSGSVWPAVLIHFLNNLTTIVLELLTESLKIPSLFWGFTVLDVVLAVLGGAVCALALRTYLRRRSAVEVVYREGMAPLPVGGRLELWLAAGPGVLAALVFTVVNTVAAAL